MSRIQDNMITNQPQNPTPASYVSAATTVAILFRTFDITLNSGRRFSGNGWGNNAYSWT